MRTRRSNIGYLRKATGRQFFDAEYAQPPRVLLRLITWVFEESLSSGGRGRGQEKEKGGTLLDMGKGDGK